MNIAGNRRILAPPHRVRTALRDPGFLATHLPPALADHTQPTDQTSDQSVAWRLAGKDAIFHLTADNEDATRLAYETEADEPNEVSVKQGIESFLDAMQSEIAGPPETAAEGPVIAVAKASQSGFPFRAMPNLIFGMPLIFWAGSAVFFFIFVFMFSAYL